jgi:hypothetical protein
VHDFALSLPRDGPSRQFGWAAARNTPTKWRTRWVIHTNCLGRQMTDPPRGRRAGSNRRRRYRWHNRPAKLLGGNDGQFWGFAD